MNRRWLAVATLGPLAAFLLVACLTPARSVAQIDDPQDAERAAAVRTKMYELLAREVAALERQSNVLKMVVKLVRPTVVHIEAEKIDPASVRYGRHEEIEEAGSGCIVKIKDRFYVLTNGHVIRAADPQRITIRLADGRTLHPKFVRSDRETDVAVMAIEAPDLVAAKIGDSAEMEIGDFVLAVGSPFGLSHSITFGIISAMRRWDLKLGEGVEVQDFIQTDAAINPGNSGGPLINLRGEVVGMNTAIASNSGGNEGIGFSIPINLAMVVAKQLVERNRVTRAHLGVMLDRKFDRATAISVGLTRTRGARITGVTPDSPAAQAELQKGDVILDFDGVRVANDSHLINLVKSTEVGRAVPLVVYRDGRAVKITVKTGRKPSDERALPAGSRD